MTAETVYKSVKGSAYHTRKVCHGLNSIALTVNEARSERMTKCWNCQVRDGDI